MRHLLPSKAGLVFGLWIALTFLPAIPARAADGEASAAGPVTQLLAQLLELFWEGGIPSDACLQEPSNGGSAHPGDQTEAAPVVWVGG